MRLIFLSGLSGSGKSVALHMLEDLDFYCVDNIPAALLKPFISHTVRSSSSVYQRTAIGIDARNPGDEIATVPTLLDELKRSGIQLRAGVPGGQRRGAAAPLCRDAAQASAEPPGREPARGDRDRARAARAAGECRRSGGRHLAHGGARPARADQPPRRPAPARPHVGADRVLRLQARHPGRCRLRVRRALAAQSLLGAER